MLGNKFSLDSDFVETYLTSYILKGLNIDRSIKNDADIFSRCVNLNKSYIKVANCDAKRDQVNSFLEQSDEAKSLKEAAKSNCKESLLKAHQSFNALNKDLTPADRALLSLSLKQAESELNECIAQHKH
jgi:hypothetical protein